MFGTKQRRAPTDTPFQHGEDCPTMNARPEWGHLGGGQWERVCNCRREVLRPPCWNRDRRESQRPRQRLPDGGRARQGRPLTIRKG
jgi:hypothetical protein